MKNGILSGNGLKIVAMVAMLLDHAGVILFDNLPILRLIGRLAYPLYAFLIAEGCRHTSSKLFYFLRIFALGMVCQVVYYFVDKSLYLNILLTFSVSIPLVYLLQTARKNAFLTALFLGVIIGLWIWCKRLYAYDIEFDYGFFGIMLPVLISVGDNKRERSILAFIGLFILAQAMGGNQMWSLLAVPLMLLYNGKRGKWNMKSFFYLFYPLHLAILYGISYLIERL